MDVEKFIKSIHRHEALWNLANRDNKNLKIKMRNWKEISIEFNISITECKKKWKGLRDSYNREQLKRKVSGQDADEMEAGWKYLKNLEFLREHIKSRPLVSNPADTDLLMPFEIAECSNSTALDKCSLLFFDELTNSSHTPNRSGCSSEESIKKRRRDLETDLARTMKCVRDFLKTTPRRILQEEEDEDELYCRAMLCKLKKFPLQERNEAKINIMK